MAKFFWNYLNIKPAYMPARLSPVEEALEGQDYFLKLQMDGLTHPEIHPMNFIIFAEHESVYSFPKKDEKLLLDRTGREKFLRPNVLLENLPAPYYCVQPIETRGKDGEKEFSEYAGSITYHGPGQLVCYLILNMTELGFSGETLAKICKIIDDAVKDFLYSLGITSYRLIELQDDSDLEVEQSLLAQGAIWKDDNGGKHMTHSASGLWVVQNKCAKKIMSRALATVPYCCEISGEKKRNYFMCFGFALNIATDLSYFKYINPCGLPLKITSIVEQIGEKGKILLPKAAESLASLFVQKIREATGDNTHQLI